MTCCVMLLDVQSPVKKSAGNALLDVACGTGKHLLYLKPRYGVEGLDIDSHMLKTAQAQQPYVHFF